MRSTLAIATLVILAASRPVAAQDVEDVAPLLFPGSVNASVGTLGPLEPGNTLATAKVEQGMTAWRRGPLFLVGFADLTLRTDSQGKPWNNTLPYVVGVKLMASGRAGVVQVAAGGAGEFRDQSARALMPAAYVTYWAGWRGATAKRHFPGSTWLFSGVSVPSEPGNWITSGHVDQGVSIWRGRSHALVPFVGVTGTTDRDAHPWNNRGFVDAGVKVSTRVGGLALDTGVAHRTTRAWRTRDTESGPVVFANLWLGWAPRASR